MTQFKRFSAFLFNSQADINKAVEVARGVKEVKSVKNEMRVK
ncbi:MAG TPA: BON domain-containing protein [Burkholderiales bacterium]|nr:BON domain-containing protein [Burkholderiales bacterium]